MAGNSASEYMGVGGGAGGNGTIDENQVFQVEKIILHIIRVRMYVCVYRLPIERGVQRAWGRGPSKKWVQCQNPVCTIVFFGGATLEGSREAHQHLG